MLECSRFEDSGAGEHMYLKRVRAGNFRTFGDGTAGPSLNWELSPGMNILVGENDAGKTAVVDAIRHILWTTSLRVRPAL